MKFKKDIVKLLASSIFSTTLFGNTFAMFQTKFGIPADNIKPVRLRVHNSLDQDAIWSCYDLLNTVFSVQKREDKKINKTFYVNRGGVCISSKNGKKLRLAPWCDGGMYDYEVEIGGRINGSLPVVDPEARADTPDIKRLQKMADCVINSFKNSEYSLRIDDAQDIIYEASNKGNPGTELIARAQIHHSSPHKGVSMLEYVSYCAKRYMPMIIQTYYKERYNRAREYSNIPRDGYKKTWIITYAYSDSSDWIRCYDPTREIAVFDMYFGMLMSIANNVTSATSTPEELELFKKLFSL